jgi:hypothetical protein
VRTLNLIVIRAEKTLNNGKGVAAEDGDVSAHSVAPKPGLPPEQHRPPSKQHRLPPDQYRPYLHADDNNHDDNRFHPHVRLEFPTFDGKDDPLPWLKRCETFFHDQSTLEDRQVWYAAMHLTGAD